MNGNSRKGFASLSKAQRAKVARLGGKTAHLLKRAHEYTKAEASRAGKIGGSKRSKDLLSKSGIEQLVSLILKDEK